jgi:hypothetical protein
MKNAKIAKLFKHQVLPLAKGDWAIHKNIVIHNPLNELLQGICVESSAFSANQFALSAFVQPLNIPLPVIILTFGYRLKTPSHKAWWEISDQNNEELCSNIVNEINKLNDFFLYEIFDAKSFYYYYKKYKKASIAHFQAIAYSACYAGLSEAKNEILSMMEFINRNEDLADPGTKELYHRTESLAKKIIEGEGPRLLLDSWITHTKKNLKI